MIPWVPGGHADAWNHVEAAMSLDVMGFHDEAERAYQWLADTQRSDGSWHQYYLADSVEHCLSRGHHRIVDQDDVLVACQ